MRREVELKDNWWQGNRADLVSPDTVAVNSHDCRRLIYGLFYQLKFPRILPSFLVLQQRGVSRQTYATYSLSTMGKDPKHFRSYKGNPVWIFKVQTTKPFFLDRSKRIILREVSEVP